MISNADFVEVVSAKLKTQFRYKIYSDEVTENYDRPSFFVQVNTGQIEYQSINVCQRSVRVRVLHLLANKDEAKSFEITDKLVGLFGVYLEVGARKLRIDRMKYETIGGRMLTFDMDFDFRDVPPIAQKSYEGMEKLEINMASRKGE